MADWDGAVYMRRVPVFLFENSGEAVVLIFILLKEFLRGHAGIVIPCFLIREGFSEAAYYARSFLPWF